MSAYRICEDCGAALDPGERCDCRGQGRVELIQPESVRADAPDRLKRPMNVNFTGAAGYAALVLAGGDKL